MCILPEDLKSFFLTTNGLLIQWSIKFDGNYWQCMFEKIMRVKVNVSWCLHRLQEAGNFGHKEFWATWLARLLRIITEHFDCLIRCFISIFSILSGSVLPLGKMELNPVTGLVLLSKATSVSDDKPSLADLDTDSDEEDGQGIDQTWGQIQEFDRGRGRGEASFD